MNIVKVVNRTNKPFEWQFDGRVFRVEGNGTLQCEEAAGHHGYRRSIMKLDPIADTAEFQLGIDGVTDCKPLVGKDAERKPELLSRESGLPGAALKAFVNPVGLEKASGGDQTVLVKGGGGKP